MDVETKSLKSGVLRFLSKNNRSGFTEKQILTEFFGDAGKVSQGDRDEMKSILEALVEEKKITTSKLSTKSGMKVYYKGLQ